MVPIIFALMIGAANMADDLFMPPFAKDVPKPGDGGKTEFDDDLYRALANAQIETREMEVDRDTVLLTRAGLSTLILFYRRKSMLYVAR